MKKIASAYVNAKNTVAFFMLMSGLLTCIQTLAQTVVNPSSPWVVPSCVTSITVEVWGGGGGGGGAKNSANANGGNAGGGGGGGGFARQILTVNPGEQYTIAIGAGGTAGATSGGVGGTGGTTTVSGTGGTVTATGGTGGGGAAGTSGNYVNGAGGAGGSGTGTTIYFGGSGSVGNVTSSFDNGGGGGGGAGNNGNGAFGTVTASNGGPGGAGGAGNPNAAPYKGGAGGSYPSGSAAIAHDGGNGTAPSGGGSGAGAWNTSNQKGGTGAAGQVVISYTLSNSPQPDPFTAAPTPVCAGDINTYTIPPVSGATSYTWTLPNGWAGTSTTTSITVTAGVSSGDISVVANTATCSSVPRTVNVVIGTPATPASISGPASVCNGGGGNYSTTTVSGATSYTWTLPNGWTGTSTTENITVTANTNDGNISVTANNGCGSSAPQLTPVTIALIPGTGTLSGPTSVCNGAINAYSLTPISGLPTYAWTLPNGWSGTSTSSTILATAGINGGVVSVVATNVCGSSPLQSLTVTSSSNPAQPGAITGPLNVCQNGSATYSITPVSGATAYTWTLPNGWTGTSTTETIDITADVTGGTISVAAVNGCGNSTAQTLPVTASPGIAAPGSISGASSVCSGTTNSYSVAPVSGATSYTWTLPNGWTGTSTSENITVTASSTGGDISVTANSSCGSSSAQTLTITVATPATPGSIAGPTNLCGGNAGTYSVTPVSGATSYTWTLPNGWTGTSTSESITVNANGSGGDITVIANNTCGSSTAQTLTVTSGAAPATPGAISGPGSVCPSVANTYSVTAVSGATSYTWTLPNGWTGSSTSESINVTANSSGGVISVTASNACGASTAQTFAVTISSGSIPAMPGTIAGPAAVCNGASGTYSVVAVGGASSYTWTLPNGWTGSSTSESITASGGSTGGSISVTANSGCGSSPAQTLTITVNPLPVVSFNLATSSICDTSAAITLSGGSPAGGTYSGNGVSGNSFSPAGLGGSSVTITYSYIDGNSCSASATANISVATCLPNGIHDLTAMGIEIYPNPFTDQVLVKTRYQGSITVTLTDMNGRILNTTQIPEGTSTAHISTAQISQGVYLLNIAVNGTLSGVQKLVKAE